MQPINNSFILHNKDLHVVFLKQSNIEYTLNVLSGRKRINKEQWLIYLEENIDMKEAAKIFYKAVLDFDDDIHVAIQNGIDQIDIWEIYKIRSNYPVQYNEIGEWRNRNNETKRLWFTSMKKWHRRHNLKGHHLNITSLEWVPFMKIKLNPRTGRYDIEGSFADMINLLSETINFTYTLKPPPDGKWNSIVDMAEKEQVDFGKISVKITFNT